MENYLQMKNVDFSYHTKEGEILALKNIDFAINQQDFVSIVGPSGCGKTTILSLIAGLQKVSGGQILLNGKDIEATNDIGYMFQKDCLFEWRTIYKNIMLPLELSKKNKNKDYLDKADYLLKKYGLYEFKDKYPNQLSGGMRQRVALIRTLIMQPKLLLLDEPFSALDYQTKLNVIDDVYSIIKNEKQTAILVTHDISEAISLSDKIIILTKRPAVVKEVVDIDLRDIATPIKRRESLLFPKYFDKIYKEFFDEK